MAVYRVMEYLDPSCNIVQGYACIDLEGFEKWRKNPKTGQVKAFAVIIGMETMSEWGFICCKRLWDYEAETDELPRNVDIEKWRLSLRRTGNCEDEKEEYQEYLKEARQNLCGIFGEDFMGEIIGDNEGIAPKEKNKTEKSHCTNNKSRSRKCRKITL
jgi:hypothetical protein